MGPPAEAQHHSETQRHNARTRAYLAILSNRSTPAHIHFCPLVHLLDQSVDSVLPISQIAALNIMLEFPLPESASGIAQLEWPQKVARLLEVRPHHHNFMHQILHTDDAIFAQMFLDEAVVGQRDALLVNLAVSAFVDEVPDGFVGWVAVGNVGFDNFEHFCGGFCEADEDSVVYLEKAEELENFSWLRRNFVDPSYLVSFVFCLERGLRANGCSLVKSKGIIYPLIRTTKTSLGSAGT